MYKFKIDVVYSLNKILIFASVLFIGCVDTPSNPDKGKTTNIQTGAMVLCEGLMGYNNSTITEFSLNDYSSEKNVYKKKNNNLLGDTANDILKNGDTAFIAVSSSNLIEVIKLGTGKNIGTIELPDNYNPRNIILGKEPFAYVSNLRNNSITSFNTKTFEINELSIPCGANPEGIAYHKNKIYTANSGLGIYNQNHPEAGTISVINSNTLNVIEQFYVGPNVQEIVIDKYNNTLFALYYGVYQNGSSGGIVQIDLDTYEKLNEWKADGINLQLNYEQNRLYFILQKPKGSLQEGWKGIAYIDLNSYEIIEYLENNVNSDFWYGYSFYKDKLFIANAKNFVVNGEILIFDDDGNILQTIETGINPNEIIFY